MCSSAVASRWRATLYNILPGYMPMRHAHTHFGLQDYIQNVGDKNGYWGHIDAYLTSMLKAWWGENATAESEYCFDYLPRLTGDHSAYQAIDHYEGSDLPERHKAALRLADAVITQPMLIDDVLIEPIQTHFSPEATTEIVLDMIRNAANKFAVAVGGDAAQVDEGIEYFDIDAGGDVVADTDPDVVRALAARSESTNSIHGSR